MKKGTCRRGFFRAALAAVAALLGLPRGARADGYYPYHHCPVCRRSQRIVYCWGPGPGQHYHRCPAGGSVFWYH